MERATIELAPQMLPVVRERTDGLRSHGRGRTLRVFVIGLALAAGLACVVVLSRGALQGESDSGRVALDGFAGTFGQTKLARMPLHNEPSTNDLISIMRGQGRQDVSADQGLLFRAGQAERSSTQIRKRGFGVQQSVPAGWSADPSIRQLIMIRMTTTLMTSNAVTRKTRRPSLPRRQRRTNVWPATCMLQISSMRQSHQLRPKRWQQAGLRTMKSTN
jgi:hypothetical protein